ncbi:MAG: hypothetical protein AAFY15_09740 [Cyanobacteria bacterium J06648_11]
MASGRDRGSFGYSTSEWRYGLETVDMLKSGAGWVAIALAMSLQSAAIAAPMKATTSDGKTVVLNDDGTWQYERLRGFSGSAGLGSKPESATEKLTSSKGFVELWFDPKSWRVDPNNDNDAAEFALNHASGDAYALVIAERLGMPMSALEQLALNNAREVSSDIQIVREESRTINGITMEVMQLEGTIQEIPFTFYGAYWVGDAGTLQVVTYTGQNLFEEFEAELTQLLNGISITKS